MSISSFYFLSETLIGLIYLNSIQCSEVHLEVNRMSTTELFCEYSQRFLVVNYFHKKAPLQILEWVLNTPLEIVGLRFLYVVHCAIWYRLYNLKNVKTTHGGMLILVKLQALA